MSWSELILAVVGGDDREAEILRLAAETGATVRGYGFPATEAIEPLMAASAEDALDGARFAAFPIPGLGNDGALFAPAAAEPIVPGATLLARMAPSGHIILGTADDRLRAVAQASGIGLHEYETDPQLMLERMPAIVEGAVQQCIAHTDVTISAATVAVVGQGNVGAHLSRTLRALGANVHVFARNPVQRASAGADGVTPHELGALETLAPRFAMVFCTVPAAVVGGLVLERLAPGTLVMDLAAPPGGVDRERAAELNIPVVWARGLGRRAPRTVGASQWGGIRQRIDTILQGSTR
jgi:dipicolinate synthase subunit A